MKDIRTREYLLPVRILASEGISNAECLLSNKNNQVALDHTSFAMAGKGYIILDFGKEINGGIRIINAESGGASLVRIRFGESVSECCAELWDAKNATNDHAVRDMEVYLPTLSDAQFGETGFRFVRIDFKSDNVLKLVNVYAVFIYREVEFKGNFECNDKIINEIFRVSRHTLHMNMQTMLWDGIKRDRLVWIGDMHPEVLGIICLFNSDVCVEESLKHSVLHNKLPCWMNTIPSYSLWFIKIVCDYYAAVKNDSFVRENLSYITGIIEQLDRCVEKDGKINFSNIGLRRARDFFLDWPTSETPNAEAGDRYFYIYALSGCIELLKRFGEDTATCKSLIDRLKLRNVEGDCGEIKQFIAFKSLSGEISAKKAAKQLLQGEVAGFSTFMSYYILSTVFDGGSRVEALRLLKKYYRGMLDMGATSFWEDFNHSWMENSGRIDELPTPDKKDIHASFGSYCYKGLRHSLCHGWSCGPIQFLFFKVMGISILQPGCKVLRINPDLCGLEWAKGSFPTPYGTVQISLSRQGNATVADIIAPDGVAIVSEKPYINSSSGGAS